MILYNFRYCPQKDACIVVKKKAIGVLGLLFTVNETVPVVDNLYKFR